MTPPKPQPRPALPLQPRLTIGQVNDPYEQEANRVARQVVNQIHRPQVQTQLPAQPIAPIADMQAKGELDGGTVNSGVERGINQAKGSGQSLSATTQTQMGEAIGADFSQVKVHTDNRADQLNRAVQARAFTTGPDIFFKRGEYNPKSRGGQELLAHELTHVVQQGAAVQRQLDPKKERFEAVAQRLQTQRLGLGEPVAAPALHPSNNRVHLKALANKPTSLMTPIQLKELLQREPEDKLNQNQQSQDSGNDVAVSSQGKGDSEQIEDAATSELPPIQTGEAIAYPIEESGSFAGHPFESEMEQEFELAKAALIDYINARYIAAYQTDDVSSNEPSDYPERRPYYNSSEISYIKFKKSIDGLEIFTSPLFCLPNQKINDVLADIAQFCKVLLPTLDAPEELASIPRVVPIREGGEVGRLLSDEITLFIGRVHLRTLEGSFGIENDAIDESTDSDSDNKDKDQQKQQQKQKPSLGRYEVKEYGAFSKLVDPDAAEELMYYIARKLLSQLGNKTIGKKVKVELHKSDQRSSVKIFNSKDAGMDYVKAQKTINIKECPVLKNKGLMIDLPGLKKEKQENKRETIYNYSFNFNIVERIKKKEDWKGVGTVAAGLSSAATQADVPDLVDEALTESDAYTIYEKVQFMIEVFKGGGDDVADQIVEIVSSGIFGAISTLVTTIKRFIDIGTYRKRLKGLQESLKGATEKAQGPGSTEADMKLQESIMYAIEKVKKLIGHTLLKAISSLVQVLSRIFTVLFGALFPPAAIIGLLSELTALAAKAVDFLVRKGKGIVKQIAGTRGKKRQESAESIFTAAVSGDSEALAAIRALNIKTIMQKAKDSVSRDSAKKKGKNVWTFSDSTYVSCKKIIGQFSADDHSAWWNLSETGVKKMMENFVVKQGLLSLFEEKNIDVKDSEMTANKIISGTTPNELLNTIEESILNTDMQQVNDESLMSFLQHFNRFTAVRKNFVQDLANKMKSSDFT
ncbi:MAG: DUF4157 domain-containing protein [Spirulina sp. SIO3F2]|nr:DUF4157 domain-containing protein [Spirulina sp. SIO3F2]